MKKKLLSLCAIILCLSFVLVGCGSNGVKFKLYAEKVNAITTGETTEVNLGTNIELVDDIDEISPMGYAIILDTLGTDAITDDTYGVYSFKDSKIIYNGAKDASFINIISEHYTYIKVRTPEVLESVGTPASPEYYTLYSPNGDIIMDKLDTITLNKSAKYDGVIYESWEQALLDEEPYNLIVKVTGEKAADRTILFSNQITVASEAGASKEWMYQDVHDPLEYTQYLWSAEVFASGIYKYHFYDLETGKELCSLELDMTKNPNEPIFIGNVWYLQYTSKVDDYETNDYDFINEGKKYKLETYKFDIKTGKLTKIKIDHWFDNQLHNHTLFENKADYIIADRIVNKQVFGEINYFATEKGLVEVDKAYQYVEKHGDNYLAVESDDDTYIIDKNGKMVVDLSAYDVKEKTANGLVIRAGAGKYGFIDYTGKFLSNGFEYNNVQYSATNGFFIATRTKDITTYYFRINAKTFEATALATKVSGNYKLGETDIAGLMYDKFGYVVVKAGEGETPEFTYEFYKNDGTLYKTVTGLDIGIPSDAINTKTFYTDNNNGYHLIEINEKIYQIKING